MRKIRLRGKGSFGSRVLRALGKTSDLELSFALQEKKCSGVSAYHMHYSFHKEIRNAMLEAERLKAKGIMEYQRRRSAF